MVVDEVKEDLRFGINPMGGDWTNYEIQTFNRRTKRLEKMGLTMQQAEHLAERLVYRDRPDSGDNRRLCVECKSFYGRCKKGLAALPFTLQRCDLFSNVGE